MKSFLAISDRHPDAPELTHDILRDFFKNIHECSGLTGKNFRIKMLTSISIISE